jgi:hypothetical protein
VGSGESDSRVLSLDYFSRCTVAGCEWQVPWRNRVCRDHGGPRDSYEYIDSADGDLLATRGFDKPPEDAA